jgi:hypothetical protein
MSSAVKETKCSKKPGEYCRLHNPKGYVSKTDFTKRFESTSHMAQAPAQYPITFASDLPHSFQTRLPEIFDPAKVKRLKNPKDTEHGMISKPRGALWLSPVNSKGESAWDSFFYSSEEERAGNKTYNHDMVFTPDAKVMVINSKADYIRAINVYPTTVSVFGPSNSGWQHTNKKGLDFEQISKTYDAVYVSQRAINETSYGFRKDHRYDSYTNLEGWDVPSMVLFNPSKVTVNKVSQF